MLSLGLELGLPLSCCVYNLGNDCKGPRSIARVLYAGEVRQGLLELRVTGLISPSIKSCTYFQ